MIRFVLYSEKMGTYSVPDEETPIGWEGLKIILARHPKYHGIFPEISLKLKWFGRPRDILKQAYDNFGVEAEVFCEIVLYDNLGIVDTYRGQIDFRDIVFTERFAECNIKQWDCLQLFLDRTNIKVNLYDEPCFSELTYDKTAYRTRYKFAPYWISFPERKITGVTSWELAGCPIDSPCDNLSKKAKQVVYNKFQLGGGLGCALVISEDPQNSSMHNHCNNTDNPENNDGAKSQFVNANGDHIYYIVNGVKLKKINDDIDLLNDGFSPQNSEFSTVLQYHRNCGNEVENSPFPESQWSIQKYNNGRFEDCFCCPDINGDTPCSDIEIDLDIELNSSIFYDIVSGYVEWVTVTPELVLHVGNSIIVLDSLPQFVDTGPNCYTGIGQWYFNQCGIPGSMSYKGTVKVPGCALVGSNGEFAIYARYRLGFKAAAATLNTSNLSIGVKTYWIKNSGVLRANDCIKKFKRVGETSHPVYMIHEAFSRVVEHYTNNCLRVKSELYRRPNSMEWADNCLIQNSAIRPYTTYIPGKNPALDECGKPKEEQERQQYYNDYCVIATTNCDCSDPKPFPICNQTFNPQPYQTPQGGKTYEEAFIVITSGISLRDYGRECYVSFDDLFEAMNAIHCIGVGYLEFDPHNLVIEHASYFYNPQPVVYLEDVDPYTSEWTEIVKMDEHYNKLRIGYKRWLQDEINTIDEFNTEREYTIPVKNVDNNLEKLCPFVASGYSIEYQRRQRYSVDSSYDSEIFIICVGRSVDPNNKANLFNTNTPQVPSHMYRAEIGVSNPSGLLDPETVYNFRISPYAMARYWIPIAAQTIWHKILTTGQPLEFNSGKANVEVCGEPPINLDPNVVPFKVTGFRCENNNVPIYVKELFKKPARVELKYPLTLRQFKQIKSAPYNAIVINKQLFFVDRIEFSFVEESKLTLIPYYTNYIKP